MATREQRKFVSAAVRKNIETQMLPEIERKELIIKQKDLLIAETLDILGSQDRVELQFGKDFISCKTKTATENVIEKQPEIGIISSWIVVVKEYLCIGLEIENISRNRIIRDTRGAILYPTCNNQEGCSSMGNTASASALLCSSGYESPSNKTIINPNDVASLVIRIPIPSFATKQKLDVLVSWASIKSADYKALNTSPISPVFNSKHWIRSQYVLHSAEYDPLQFDNYPAIRNAQDISSKNFTKAKLLALHVCQMRSCVNASKAEILSQLSSSGMPVNLINLSRNHMVLSGSHLLNGIRLQVHDNSVDVFAWDEKQMALIVNILKQSSSITFLKVGQVEHSDTENDSIRQKNLDSAIEDIKDSVKQNDSNSNGKGPNIKISGLDFRNLNDKLIDLAMQTFTK